MHMVIDRNGKNGGKPHPRHRNGQPVKKGKCQRCIIINGGEENTVEAELEDHHEIPKKYGGAGGPKRESCPDCHMLAHQLIDDYVDIVVTENTPAILEINRRHYAGEILTSGDLREIALRHKGGFEKSKH